MGGGDALALTKIFCYAATSQTSEPKIRQTMLPLKFEFKIYLNLLVNLKSIWLN
jgi:hypothetical protein